MTGGVSREDAATEHQIFWMLVKKARKRDDVGRVYLAVQAAIAYEQETVDVGWLTTAMMAEGQDATNADGDAIGARGLAYFCWLYEVELISVGETNCHQYRFHRRHDGAQVLALLKTANAPRSLQFQQEYEREKRYLESRRAALLPNYRRTSGRK